MSTTGCNDSWSGGETDAFCAAGDVHPYALGVHYREGDVLGGELTLMRKLGEGAMGAVWLASDAAGGHVAVKLMRPEVRSSELMEYFLREGRAAQRVCHPGVVRMVEVGETEVGDPYLVMELVEGDSLRSALAREGSMAPERAVALLLPVASAIHEAHAQGVIHRDLKPENVMLSPCEGGGLQPKVIDFGVAKILQNGEEDQSSGGFEVFGTPDYMPPEQALASPLVDGRADVWSFCAMLYELVSGKPPFSSRNALDGLRAVLQDTVPSLVERCGFDATLWAIIERGLEKDAAARWSSMRQLGEALAAWLWSRGVREDVRGASLEAEWLGAGHVGDVPAAAETDVSHAPAAPAAGSRSARVRAASRLGAARPFPRRHVRCSTWRRGRSMAKVCTAAIGPHRKRAFTERRAIREFAKERYEWAWTRWRREDIRSSQVP